MSRIQQIRDIIVEAGGNPNFTYYCDGPRSGMGPSKGKGDHKGQVRSGDSRVSYKIERYTDGFADMSDLARECVVANLRALPDVEVAYLTKPRATTPYQRYTSKPNIKVIFKNRAR